MKLTYKMTADEFYKGYNYKIQKIGLNNVAEIVSLVVIMIASIVASVLGVVNATVILPFAILLCILFVYKQISAKNSITIEFQRSIILNDENTLRLYDEVKTMKDWKFFQVLKRFMPRGKAFMRLRKLKVNL